MRAIALAILLAGFGIEGVLMKMNGKTWEHENAHSVFELCVFVGFFICLIWGT